MQKNIFINHFLPAATQAGDRFNLNPAIILAQAAIESGWGESYLAKVHHNFFGITGYGKPNLYWNGSKTEPATEGGPSHLQFRIYESELHSFMDFARLIRSAYPIAASMSFHPEAYAKEIAYSKYISEVNGDNREDYRRLLVGLASFAALHCAAQ
ncbi:glucosaminidase domain-containing protein [Parabacteroides bouchesdurhonensis]|uniref:glucosaminidase domain-containing protein n=1 Tax=Parabacteroides bouchesdurhonensis TaxID=1936995 RepID=UPI000E4838BE|nr:glucosaminidase domain-containing protein [Parabacteroides bouchesdurhonensis]RHJ94924.1 glucosaminidase [Bacteroides sp. AM07-16]